jgi:hypothetical protein
VGKDATRIDGRSGEGAVRKGARSWRGVSANVSGIDSIVQRDCGSESAGVVWGGGLVGGNWEVGIDGRRIVIVDGKFRCMISGSLIHVINGVQQMFSWFLCQIYSLRKVLQAHSEKSKRRRTQKKNYSIIEELHPWLK